ncbi:MAG: Hsp20/alpha crystallin family protein [Solirubrobacteraceae bacterium]|nr:Hsp20/alpha crystallin family protein [Solirubrobacteraceae bacterium]
MATILQPIAPWMRDLSRFMNTPGAASAFLPPADVLVGEDDVTVYMDVPGIAAENLDIQLENDMLTVRGERRPPWESLEGCTARIERSFGAFERTLRVTDGLDPDGIEASMRDGVLVMRLPQPAQTQPRRIQIRPGTTSGNGAGMPASGEGGPADSAPAAGEPQGGAGESAPGDGNGTEGGRTEAPSPAAPSGATA